VSDFVHGQTGAVLHLKNLLLTNSEQTSAVCRHWGTQPDQTLSIAQYKMNRRDYEPNCVKSIFEVFRLAARLYKVLDDVEIIATSMTEPLGLVQDEARIQRRGDLLPDIWDAGFATVFHNLMFEVSRLPMILSA
jgi:hypothetical protein